jgi:hypothetical protein
VEGAGGEDESGGDHGYGDAVGPGGLVVYLGWGTRERRRLLRGRIQSCCVG